MSDIVYGLLDVLVEAYFVIGWLILAIGSFAMMSIGVQRAHIGRKGPAGLLAAGIAYAVVNIAVFLVTFSVDAFAIFHLVYISAVALVGPALMIGALILLIRTYPAVSWLSGTGFVVWVACVTFAHLFVVAAFSASV